jgi:hypothetical protein
LTPTVSARRRCRLTAPLDARLTLFEYPHLTDHDGGLALLRVHRSIVGEGIYGGAAPAKRLNRATVDEMTQIRALEMRKLTLDMWRCSAVKMVHGNEIHLADNVVVLRKGISKLA